MSSNFAFLAQTLPEIHADCRRAESYVASDPSAACFYGRRAIERAVAHVYAVRRLPEPYRDDLAARIGEAAFGAEVGVGIVQKLHLIRKVGNTAVHDSRPVAPQAALQVLRELFHVAVFVALRYTTDPQGVPSRAQFDPDLAVRQAPLSRGELVNLAKKFEAQDEAHAKELAERDDLAAAQEAEIAALREQIAAAQAVTAVVDDHDYSEAETRTAYIDVLLRESGWLLDQPRDREFEVSGMPRADGGTGRGFVDYVLWGADNLPLALVEAKRTTRSPEEGRQQASLYADRIEAQFGRRPVIYCSNGYEHQLWDDAAFSGWPGPGGGYPPREVQGFHTRDELELMVQRRTARLPLAGAPVATDIAGRYYQRRAIAAVGAAFDSRQREALLVMATGSGKTRTVIALVDQLMKQGWAKRVLFLADRTALVTQAVNAFKAHLPGSSPVNLTTERSADGRVYVATYPTMLNLINEVSTSSTTGGGGSTSGGGGSTSGGGGSTIGASGTRRFGPGYFDVVVIDEAHRSVYQKYGAIFDHLDAHLVGLTATPKDEVDHNTYRLFHLEDGVPTDAYGLEEAVRDDYLVPPFGVTVGTSFLRQGIRYDDLGAEERDAWDAMDWGEDGPPDAVDSEELNRFLFNADTVDKVLATLMSEGHKVAGGDRLGKTIVFAKNQLHAEFIEERFNAQYPEHGGAFARVITSADSYSHTLLEQFTRPESAPHVAISVDMLDTGIDVPEVVNLVFFKAVRSKSKFWQMIGRGTRLCPDLFGPGHDKSDFLVFDFCGNLEFFRQDLPTSEGSLQKSLTQRLFEHRVGLVVALDEATGGEDHDDDLRGSTATWLREVVAGMNLENVLVRRHHREVERWSEPAPWTDLGRDAAEEVLQLAGLPSGVRDPDEDAKRFDLLILRRQLAQLESDAAAAERVRETIQAIAAVLLGKTAIPVVREQAALLDTVAGDDWWVDVTLPMLELVRLRLRALVRLVERTRQDPVYTDFVDTLDEPEAVDLPQVTVGMNWERFEAKARAYLRDHEDHLALQKLRRGKQLTAADLEALGELLVSAGGDQSVDLRWVRERGGELGPFVRSLVGLDRAAVLEAFAAYLDEGRFAVEQVRFVEMIVDELTGNGVMSPGRLFESPYTDHGRLDVMFPNDAPGIVAVLRELDATSRPA